MMRLLACIFALPFVVACSGGSSGAAKDDPARGSASGASTASASSTDAEGSGSKRELSFDDVSPRAVTSLDFVDQELVIGFSDGAIAAVSPNSGSTRSAKVAKAHSVAAVAPTGDLALLASNPPVIVNFEGELILQMNTVPSFESATFAPRGMTLYVADEAGKIRIWGQPHSFEEDQHTEKLENYLNRQAPDFHVEFPPVSGPIRVTDTNKLVVVDDKGVVRVWDPTRPSSAKQVMKVGGGARSISSSAGRVFVTSRAGQLKIGNADGSGFLPWTQKAKGDYVVATPLATETFYQLDSGQLRARNIESGDDVWSTPLPDGHPCGLAISADAATLAACVGNFIALFDAQTGAPRGYGYRASGDFEWKAN